MYSQSAVDLMIEIAEPLIYFIEALFSWRFSLVMVLTVALVWWVFDTISQSNLQMAIGVPLGFVGFALALFWEHRTIRRKRPLRANAATPLRR